MNGSRIAYTGPVARHAQSRVQGVKSAAMRCNACIGGKFSFLMRFKPAWRPQMGLTLQPQPFSTL